MSIRPILLYPDPKLLQVSVDVGHHEWNEELYQLALDLCATMKAAHGAGLAAPQVGVFRRVVAITGGSPRDPDDKPLVMVNPVIKHLSGNRKKMREGCLSFPGVFEWVERSLKVQVEYADGLAGGDYKTRSFKGLQAHAIQHEVEHLDGHLLSENVSAERRPGLTEEIKKALATSK